MQDLIYVGIGASAGGLKALEELVDKLPNDMNYIYIIAQHLSPNKKSSLATILSRNFVSPVIEIDSNTKFLPNSIYVIPSNHNLVLDNHHLRLEKMSLTSSIPIPSIDTAFESLATYKKKNCIGIVLTGSGKDGTTGIRKIKENGGLIIVQNPKEAQYPSMPKSAIATGDVDEILNIKEIAKYLSTHILKKKHLRVMILPHILDAIKKILKKRENLDINKYKSDTIMRRINKRMLLTGKDTQEKYLDFIKTNQQEVHLLHQDILIGVTSFFRDEDSFKALEKQLIAFLKDKPENYKLRVWSIACSSGEEAYSLAILISEICKKLNKKFIVHIFATDIDDEALEVARSANYSKSAISNLDKNLIDEYFTKTKDGYRVIHSLREQIVFTHHNLLSEPPFINQDIISCRNLLIYIKPQAQEEIFSLFHYSLKEHGILFLGSSESTLINIRYLLALDNEYKIYIKEKLKNPPKISNHYFSKHLELNDRAKPIKLDKTQTVNIEEQISKKIFDFFAPECVLIDKDYSIIYKKGELPFIHLSSGFVTLNILDNIDEILRYDIMILLTKAFNSGKIEKTKFIEINSQTDVAFVRIVAHPFKDISQNTLLLLYFQKLSAAELEFNSNNVLLPDESFMIQTLTTQLQEIKKQNSQLLDKMYISRENMQLLNEELQSSNEELQSSNEELETSNEELQSSNEELQRSMFATRKLEQHLSLILNSTFDGMIGLDIEGNLVFVNDVAAKMLGFLREDVLGKDVHQLLHQTKFEGKHEHLKECPQHTALINGISQRKEDLYWRKNGTSFEVEVSQNPIIENKKITGAVLVFHDITEKNRLKKIAQHEHQLADLFMNIDGTIIMTLDLSGNITMLNEEGCRLLGVEHDWVIGKSFIGNFIPKEIQDEVKNVFNKVVNEDMQIVSHYKNAIVDASGKTHLISWTNNYTKDESGKITGLITSGIDITSEEELLKKLAQEENLYKLTFEEADIGIAHASLDRKWIDANEYLCNLLGYTKEEFKHLSVAEITHLDDIQNDKKMIKELLCGKRENYHIEKRYIRKNGGIVWVNIAVVILKNEMGKPLYFLKIIRDVTELKLLVYQLENEKNKLKNIIEFIPTPILLYDEDGKVLIANKILKESIGYTKEEILDTDFLVENICKEEERKSLRAFFAKPFKTNKVEQKRQTVYSKAGKRRVGIFNSILLKNPHENNKKVVISVMVDITELQNKEDIMLAQSRQAAMGDMLTMIAHQWRQPLSIISMVSNNIHAQLELQGKIKAKDIKEYIKTLDEQSSYLSDTIDDFRNFFKPDIVKETISFNSIFEKILTLLQKSLQNNDIPLILPKNGDIKIFTYPNQLIQVIINIINNSKDAIKEKNNEHGVITVSIDENKQNVVLKICDNGGGIDPSVKDKLGQPYVSTKSKNGTGLGIYMSMIIVSKHLGGRLYWDSNDGNTCFYIELPKKVS
ncbi:MAG: PAS domain S-box protein [Epsilonproteobacteria bacterium]|nr:PAS domain S-box protein [Campylobacterota bacterium]